MTVKKTLVSLALTIPLLTACGSGDTAESTATGVPTQSTVTSTRSVEPSTEEETTTEEPTETTEEETVEEPTEEVVEEPAPEAAPVDPILEDVYREPDPVQGGHEPTEAQRAEIEQLVRGVYQVDTFHQWLRYFPDNTCHEVLAAQGGEQAMDLNGIPDQRLADMPMYADANPHIASITDVQVNGDRASAVVTAVSAGQSETRTQRYLYEDGRWKFCS